MRQRADEARRLEGYIDDLISASAVPELAYRTGASAIAATFLELLIRDLGLDFACARLADPFTPTPVDIVRVPDSQRANARPHNVSQAIDGWLAAGPPRWPYVVPNPFGEGHVALVLLPLGLQHRAGHVIAGSGRAGFATKSEMLILRVAANQIALALNESQRTAERRQRDDNTGERNQFSGTAPTIERKRASRLVSALNARLEMVLDSIPDQFFALNKDWRYTYFNKHAAAQLKVLGKDPANLIGKILWDEFPHVPNEAALRRAMSERVPVTDEHFYPPLKEWVENHICPCIDGGLVILQRYITERKRAEQQLSRSEAYLAEGQRLTHTGSWAWYIESNNMFWSEEQFRIFGFEPHGPMPDVAKCLQAIHPEDRPFIEAKLKCAPCEPRDCEWDYRIVTSDGTIKHAHTTAHPIFESGKLTEYVGTTMDTSESVRSQEALLKAQAQLAQITRILTVGELTASIAHELNQPLAAVVTNASAALRWLDAKPADLRETRAAAERIIRDANRAASVIDRIRAFVSRGESHRIAVNVNELVMEAATLLEGEARGRSVMIRVEPSAQLAQVFADRVHLQQVIVNLLVNAMDAMLDVQDTSRMLTLGTEGYGSDAVLVTVRDSGKGVDPGHRDRIFDAFYTTKAEGMGMGLAISRSIVEAHGGRLWATRNDDRGETFQFTLPIANTAAVD
ncbi:MAG: PAS domain-containing sensor histidine kinase [Burkholderiales bacterium]